MKTLTDEQYQAYRGRLVVLAWEEPHTEAFGHTRAILSDMGIDPSPVIEELKEMGGYSDAEVCLNCPPLDETDADED